MVSAISPGVLCLSLSLSLSTGGPGPMAAPASQPETKTEAAAGETIEIVVEKTRPDWLFPGLDHPRVQAFFRSGSTVGGSLFDPEGQPMRRPLVRAGLVRVRGADDRSTRRAARRFARELVADVRPALEACYADALQRAPADAVQLTLEVRIDQRDRGPVHLAAGTLGDVYGNACVLGVLEFAEVRSPALAAVDVEIPVWFWLQEM